MKNLILKPLLTILVLLQSTFCSIVRAGDPTETAHNVVNSTMMAAKADASSLVLNDLNGALLEAVKMAEQSVGVSSNSEVAALVVDLETASKELAATPIGSEDFSRAKIDELWFQYRRLVQNRLLASYQLQYQLYQSRNVYTSIHSLLENFRGQCKTGHAIAGLDYLASPIPNIGGVNFQIQVGYQSQNGQNSLSASLSTQTSTGKDKNREAVGTTLNTAATLASNMAMSAETGAIVAKAAAVAPYLAAVAIAYAVISHFMAAEDQARLLNEIAEANTFMLTHTATEKDVARFYQEACSNYLPFINDLDETLNSIAFSDQTRSKELLRAHQSKELRMKYADESKTIESTKEWLIVYYGALNHACEGQKAQEKSAPCVLKDHQFISQKNNQICLSENLGSLKGEFETKKAKVKEFGEKYSPQVRSQFTRDFIVEILAPEWVSAENGLVKFSFELADRYIESAFSKLNLILGLYRSALSESWKQERDPIFEELKIGDAYDRLTSKYSKIMAKAIKIIFNHGDRLIFQKEVEAFVDESKSFTDANYSVDKVRVFSNLVDQLKATYVNL